MGEMQNNHSSASVYFQVSFLLLLPSSLLKFPTFTIAVLCGDFKSHLLSVEKGKIQMQCHIHTTTMVPASFFFFFVAYSPLISSF